MSNSGETYYNIFIDGQLTVLQLQTANNATYPLAAGLADGVHTARVFKRDSPWRKQTFGGFILDAGKKLCQPPARSNFRMEFYGDSQLQGARADAPGLGPDPKGAWYYDDNYHAFGAITARAFGADYSCIAKNGMRLTPGRDKDIASVYDRFGPTPGSTPAWNFAAWQAQVVCVDLGENDMPFSAATFTTNYIAFVKTLRSQYPQAHIFLLSGPLGGGESAEQVKAVAEVTEALRKNGDGKVDHYRFRTTINHSGHPRLVEHLACAQELVAFIKSKFSTPAVLPTAEE
jgi:hypothetical protein